MHGKNIFLFSENREIILWAAKNLAVENSFSHGRKSLSELKNFLYQGGILLLDGISFSEIQLASFCEVLSPKENIALLFTKRKSLLTLSFLFPEILSILIFKSSDVKKLFSLIENAADESSLEKNTVKKFFHEEKLSFSPSYKEYLNRMTQAAKCDEPVLLLGESGSGKNYSARIIHDMSLRKEKEFVEVKVSELNLTLLASELYGTVKGAFTGAENTEGYFSRAQDGTLFLDEIAELPYEHQAKLLGVLDTKTFRKTGSTLSIAFNARLMFATDANLKKRMEEGLFRKQLYYRISVIVVTVPPLRERREEIIPLANKFAAECGKSLSSLALEKLYAWSWPGNVRELKNTIIAASGRSNGEVIEDSDICFE